MSTSNSPTVDTAGLTYYPKEKKFVGERSGLVSYDPFTVWNNLWLKSHKTGQKVLFQKVGAETDREGDIAFWIYEGRISSFDTNVLTLIVYND